MVRDSTLEASACPLGAQVWIYLPFFFAREAGAKLAMAFHTDPLRFQHAGITWAWPL